MDYSFFISVHRLILVKEIVETRI